MPDYRIIDEGTIVGIVPLTDLTAAWLDEHCDIAPAKIGLPVWCDHRMAQPIIDHLAYDGYLKED